MVPQVVRLSVLLVAASAAPQKHNLPVLFQFSHPTHNVAVFRGADLKNAIASGLVKGFGAGGLGGAGDAGSAAGAGGEARDGRADDGATAAAAVVPQAVAPFVHHLHTPVAYQPAPAPVVYKPAPAPVVYKPAPAPVIYKPAPAPVIYKPAPAPVVAYKPAPAYAEPAYPDIPAHYNYEYAVLDGYTNNDFNAAESRDGYLTEGRYSVALPDGRVQTVTYTVDGGAGYVPLVEYAGEAVYPPAPAGGYPGETA